mgnify:FL=1
MDKHSFRLIEVGEIAIDLPFPKFHHEKDAQRNRQKI